MFTTKLAIGLFIGACAVLGIGSTALEFKMQEKFEEKHQPEENDCICRRCKSCCELKAHENGYGARAGSIKYTYYCSKCGNYYNVWR